MVGEYDKKKEKEPPFNLWNNGGTHADHCGGKRGGHRKQAL